MKKEQDKENKALEKEAKALEKEMKKLGKSGNSMDILVDLRIGPLSDSYHKAINELKNDFLEIENLQSKLVGEELENFK